MPMVTLKVSEIPSGMAVVEPVEETSCDKK